MTARPSFPTADDLAVAKAVQCLRGAAGALQQSVFWLDDAGCECASLDDLTHDATALLAVWHGRAAPSPETPAYIAEAAAAWRAERDRRRR